MSAIGVGPRAGPARAFHHADEVSTEVELAGFSHERLVAVEGFGWLLANLAQLLQSPAQLLQAIALTESEPSMLGVSAHLIAVATKPFAGNPAAPHR